MPKRMPVGRSFRTDVKHKLMNDFIGEEVGVVSSLHRVDRHNWFDLTAGDAAGAEDHPWHKSCSPGLLAYHASRARKTVLISLYEVHPVTYRRLLDNLGSQLPALGYSRYGDSCWCIGDRVTLRAFNANGRTADVGHVCPRDAVLVLNDPNAITEWAMRPSFAGEIAGRTEWFRSLSTLGCNVCGIKRGPLAGPEPLPFDEPDLMPPNERRNWFRLIGALEQEVPEKRDLLLAAIERDSSQWAYLISTAIAGAWRHKTAARVRAAFARERLTADLAWYREDPEHFERLKESLFLTQKELRERANTPLPFGDLNGEAS